MANNDIDVQKSIRDMNRDTTKTPAGADVDGAGETEDFAEGAFANPI